MLEALNPITTPVPFLKVGYSVMWKGQNALPVFWRSFDWLPLVHGACSSVRCSQ